MRKSRFSNPNRNGETQVLQPAHTIRLKPEGDRENETPADRGEAAVSITWCGLTDTGKVRDHNEDYFSCTDLRDGTLFIVADGMGGHDAGEVASRLAVETATGEIRKGAAGTYDPEKLLRRAVLCANSKVLEEAAGKGSNMGTTLNLALVDRDRAYIANVGDSRAYWIGKGSIRRITEDHSLVEKLVSVGRLTREAARNHPKSNVLYRNVGSEISLPVDTFQVPLRKGGSLLLCTDGLWSEIPDEVILKILSSEDDARNSCASLIEVAKENGGKDNITAVVVKVL